MGVLGGSVGRGGPGDVALYTGLNLSGHNYASVFLSGVDDQFGNYGVSSTDASAVNYFAGKVGIGTAFPGEKMQLEVKGSVSIYDGAPGNYNNGDNSLFFGREQQNAYTFGEWGIQYVKSGIIGNPVGGLNFWKPSPSDGTAQGLNNILFITDNGNLGIGTSAPDASSLLDVYSTNKGLLIPNVALTGANDATTIASPATSLLVYNPGTYFSPAGYYYNAGTPGVPNWISLSSNGGNAWQLAGNAGTNPPTDFIGTTDNKDVVFERNGVRAGLLNQNYGNTDEGNTSWGVDALPSPSTNSLSNVAIGCRALYSTHNGTVNTAIGNDAGGAYDGNFNTFLGAGANANAAGLQYATAVGCNALARDSEWLELGNVNTQIYSPTNVSILIGSDRRFKNNVQENVKGLEFIKKLRPVTYQMDTKKLDDFIIQNMPDSAKIKHQAGMDFAASTAKIRSGFIAQEVAKAAIACGFSSSIVGVPADTNTGIYSLGYTEIVVPLVKAVQELSHIIDSMASHSKTIDSLMNKQKISDSLNALQIAKQNVIINSLLNHQKKNDSLITVALNCCATGATHKTMQNNESNDTAKTTLEIKLSLPAEIYMSEAHPNPNNGKAEIDYYLPSSVSNAQIVFIDMLGKVINEVKLVSGYGTISVDTQNLASGNYTFTLVTDGKVYDTKKMVRSK